MKIVLLAIAGVLLGIQFKGARQEYAMYIGMVLCMLILGAGLKKLEEILSQMEVMQRMYGEHREYFAILLKVIGITYLCEFAAGICKDAGYQAVAGQIEVFGKLSVLLSGMPILLAVLQTIQDFSI